MPADYVCLSYVWGDIENLVSIEINDGILRVGESLWQFLDVASSENARSKNLGLPKSNNDESA